MKALDECLTILFLLDGCDVDIQAKLTDPTISNYLMRWPGDSVSQLIALKGLRGGYINRRAQHISSFIEDYIDERIAALA